jgi:hypothetical protein
VHQRLWGKKLKPLVAPSAKKGSSSALDSTTEKPVGASPPTTPDGATCGDCGSLAEKSSAGGSPDSKSPARMFQVFLVFASYCAGSFLQWLNIYYLSLVNWMDKTRKA